MANLPPEILMGILCQQSVKDLLRYRSVCKQWYSLIDGPDFIKMHLRHHALPENTSCVIVTGNCVNVKHPGDSRLFWVDDLHALEPAVRPLASPLADLVGPTMVVGSCNGLLALCSRHDLALWNPSTGSFRKLPKIPREHIVVFGFGHDPVDDDYKLVKLAQSSKRDDSVIKVCSAKSNTWKGVIGHELNNYYIISPRSGVFLGNILHWVVARKTSETTNSNKTIMWFDVVTEESHEVFLPDSEETLLNVVDLGVIGGSLCAVFNPLPVSPRVVISVWVMKEYGVEESWTKLFSVNPLEGDISAFRFVSSLKKDGLDKVVLNSTRKLTWYDVERERDEKTLVVCGQCTPFSTQMCIGSLVGLGDSSIGKLSWEKEKKQNLSGQKRVDEHSMPGLCFRKASNPQFSFGEGSNCNDRRP